MPQLANRAFIVGMTMSGQRDVFSPEVSLDELALLADTAGFHVVGQLAIRVRQIEPSTLVTSSKLDEITTWINELDAGAVIFDLELSPRHQRQLEQYFGTNTRVLDRTTLILDIFAQHARSREGALQVKLAQYEYLLPRLTRQWTHLARQAGGSSGRGGVGGVGLRGPGETQLETDRRTIRRTISRIRSEIEAVRVQRRSRRRQRGNSGIPLIAIVGYTNAGKSTLLNQMSGSDVYTADQLFATLDPTTRRVKLGNTSTALFTDTVGFIQRLPHSLVAAFRATLEEVADADVMLHVIDATSPNADWQAQVVEHTLTHELGIVNTPCVRALNKIDMLESRRDLEDAHELASKLGAVEISAKKAIGLEKLKSTITESLEAYYVPIEVRISHSHFRTIARFRQMALIDYEDSTPDEVVFRGRIHRQHAGEFETFAVRNVHG